MFATKGKVIIVGAGPGDPELLTLKAARWLQMADVVLADRLVSPEILSRHVNDGAEIIPVGKQCRKGASTPQASINELMMHHALAGKLVVRLKGGDISIFSNVLDELQTLSAHGIEYELVPGVTAALGAAAYAGMPLTARDHSTAVRFLTCHKAETIRAAQWKELASTEDTLVFYMSADTLPQVVQQLKRHGIAADKELAIVEQATTPQQRITVASLYGEEAALFQKNLASPTLVIIGRVVALHHQFKWLENGAGAEYFPPVSARLINCDEDNQANLLTA